jgi:hypothetical protein
MGGKCNISGYLRESTLAIDIRNLSEIIIIIIIIIIINILDPYIYKI